MCRHDHRPSAHQSADGGEDHVLGLAVETGGGLVEEEEGGVTHEGAGECHPLTLAHRESRPALAQPGRETAGEAVHHRGEAGIGHGGLHLGVGGIRPSQTDVLRDRASEEVGALGDPGDRSSPGIRVERGQVDTSYLDRPVTDRDEAEQGSEQRGLPRAAGSGDGHHFTGVDGRRQLARAGRRRPG